MLYGKFVLDHTLNRVKYLIALTLIDLGHKQIGYQIVNRSWNELRGWDKIKTLKLAIKSLKEEFPMLTKELCKAYREARYLLINNYPEL